MSLSTIIQAKVEQERRGRELDDFQEWLEEVRAGWVELEEQAPDTDRWPRPPWCLDLPLQPETELPSVILT
jgi:hypothetical protein